MLCIRYFIVLDGQSIKKISYVAFGKPTSQAIYPKQRTRKIG